MVKPWNLFKRASAPNRSQPEPQLQPHADWARADTIWTRGNNNSLGWPHRSMMVSDRFKLLYMPVAKCACSTLKKFMVLHSEAHEPEEILRLGVHRITDRYNTGIHLKDRPIEYARDILASDQYHKFGVVREPMERLISAYLEKFVYNRHLVPNQRHTAPVIKTIQCTDVPDLERGISFNQFLEYILGQEPAGLDPHWKPQYLYFQGVEHVSRIFRLEDLEELEQWLAQVLGTAVKLDHANRTGRSSMKLAGAPSLPAADIAAGSPIDPVSLLDTPLLGDVRRYFEEDLALYGGFSPA